MGRLILDTSVLIDAERGLVDLQRLTQPSEDVCMAAVTVAEMLVGVELSDGRSRRRRESFVEGLLEGVPIVSYDLDVARAHASLIAWARRAGSPRGAHDLIVAATAAATQREVVTSDVRGFAGLPGVGVRDA